jgi:hypothetical protein
MTLAMNPNNKDELSLWHNNNFPLEGICLCRQHQKASTTLMSHDKKIHKGQSRKKIIYVEIVVSE